MSDQASEAIASFTRWNNAFNARDTEAQIAEMHFPHRRLNDQNEFQVWQTADEFRAPQDGMTERLRAEGWDHTTSLSVEAVQSGADKVHLAIRQSRQRADNTEYNGFDTLWIFTKIEGRWGVQFRSSFLANAVQGRGGGQETR
ncbi:MAG: hypothetical protein O3A76_17350 [Chloroflexi bacterium]|nr:hypothetical protein [Chloroflexota bacterium]